MPKITKGLGPTFEGEVPEDVIVQEPVLAQPYDRPGEGAEEHPNLTPPATGAEEQGYGDETYAEFSKDDLVAEIKRRNENRAEEDRLAVSGNKDELIERLVADDTKDGEGATPAATQD